MFETTTLAGPHPVTAVAADDSALTELERRMEACRPKVRLCECGGCGKLLVNEIDARAIRKQAEAVRALFPTESPAGRVKGRPACRACFRPKTRYQSPALAVASAARRG